jgi:hypothetical protein
MRKQGAVMCSITKQALLMIVILVLTAVKAGLCVAENAGKKNADVRELMEGLVGEWVGTSEHFSDGKLTDRQYFRSVTKTISIDSYETRTTFYRLDKSSAAMKEVGSAKIISTVGSDGVVSTKTTGEGSFMVEGKAKKGEHELIETIQVDADGQILGKGSGKISISGLLLGGGEKGRISQSRSIWSLKDGVCSVQQEMKVEFKVFCFCKNVNMKIIHTSRKGTDLEELLKRQ